MPVDKQAYLNAGTRATSIAAGAGLRWRKEHRGRDNSEETTGELDSDNVRTLNRGTSTPPARQVQTHNRFSALASLDDTILEDELLYRDYRAAYRDPVDSGYRVPRILAVSGEPSEDMLVDSKKRCAEESNIVKYATIISRREGHEPPHGV
jgi:hypothetical protein